MSEAGAARAVPGDIHVQCTRCRNKHMESERKEGPAGRFGLRKLLCPRCGGHTYYKLDPNGKGD